MKKTLTKQLEKSINSLFNEIKEIELDQETISEINIKGFLYNCGRLNQLQITAFLTIVALQNKMPKDKILDSLEGDF